MRRWGGTLLRGAAVGALLSFYVTLFQKNCAIPLALHLFPNSTTWGAVFLIIFTTGVTVGIVVVVEVVCWLFLGRRRKKSVRAIVSSNMVELKRARIPLEDLVREFDFEVRFDEHSRDTLRTLTQIFCDATLLAKDDHRLVECARKYPELVLVCELRECVTFGLDRLRHLLNNREIDDRAAINRSKEPLHDVESFHSKRLQHALLDLGGSSQERD